MALRLVASAAAAARPYETVSAASEGIGRYINFYNTRPPHSSHQARTPDVVHFASLPQPSVLGVTPTC
jgi:hypothetical protein